MIKREEILKSSEYWTEIIQNKIYNDLINFISENKISNKQLVEKLGLSKGRISQILSGENINFRLDTLTRLCLAINKVPDFQLIDIAEFINSDRETSNSVVFRESEISPKAAQAMISYIPGYAARDYSIVQDKVFSVYSQPIEEFAKKDKAA